MAILSQRAYALHRKTALSTVQKAIATHRISTEPDGRIDAEKADREWLANTRQRQPSLWNSGQETDNEFGIGGAQYRKARAIREHYQARLAKLEYEHRKGELLRKDDVEMATFNMCRQVRDAMLNIPDRIAAAVAAEADAAVCYEMISNEVRQALEGLSARLAEYGARASTDS